LSSTRKIDEAISLQWKQVGIVHDVVLAQQRLVARPDGLVCHPLSEWTKRVHLIDILDAGVVPSAGESGIQFLICRPLFVTPVVCPDVASDSELLQHRLIGVGASSKQVFEQLRRFSRCNDIEANCVDQVTCIQGNARAGKYPPLWDEIDRVAEVASAVEAANSRRAPRHIDARSFGAVGDSPPALEVNYGNHLMAVVQTSKTGAVAE